MTFPSGPAFPGTRPTAPTSSSPVRVHAGIALGVILGVGSIGSMIAFLMGAFAGDACGYADSPPICSSAIAAWTVMLEPGLATLAAVVVAAIGLSSGARPRGHGWAVAAWLIWLGGGAVWLAVLATSGLV